MTNWQKYKLEDLAEDIAMGPFGSNIKTDNFRPSGVPVIRGQNLVEGGFDNSNFVFISEEKAQSLKRSIAYPDELVFTHRGTLGQVGVIPKNKYPYYLVSQSQMRLAVKKDILNPKFLYYFFKSQIGQNELLKNVSQVGVPAIASPTKSLKDIDIIIPDLPTQSRIASILSCLDDKIELNHRMNQTLEQMAQALFNHYFVDNIDPDNLPEGWTQKSIGEVVSVKDGTHDSPKPKEYGYYLITSKHIKGSKIDFNQAYFISDKDYIDVNRRSKVDTYDILLTMIGTVGVVHLVTENPVNFAIKNIGLFKSSERTDLFEFIYLYLSSKKIKDYLETRTTGSTQQYLTLQTLRNIPITIPTDSVLKDFKSKAHPLIRKIRSNDDEVLLLTKIRDTLLPKLMSDEIDVDALLKKEEQRIENLETA
jgi:type I restriction enzyme S subunit